MDYSASPRSSSIIEDIVDSLPIQSREKEDRPVKTNSRIRTRYPGQGIPPPPEVRPRYEDPYSSDEEAMEEVIIPVTEPEHNDAQGQNTTMISQTVAQEDDCRGEEEMEDDEDDCENEPEEEEDEDAEADVDEDAEADEDEDAEEDAEGDAEVDEEVHEEGDEGEDKEEVEEEVEQEEKEHGGDQNNSDCESQNTDKSMEDDSYTGDERGPQPKPATTIQQTSIHPHAFHTDINQLGAEPLGSPRYVPSITPGTIRKFKLKMKGKLISRVEMAQEKVRPAKRKHSSGIRKARLGGMLPGSAPIQQKHRLQVARQMDTPATTAVMEAEAAAADDLTQEMMKLAFTPSSLPTIAPEPSGAPSSALKLKGKQKMTEEEYETMEAEQVSATAAPANASLRPVVPLFPFSGSHSSSSSQPPRLPTPDPPPVLPSDQPDNIPDEAPGSLCPPKLPPPSLSSATSQPSTALLPAETSALTSDASKSSPLPVPRPQPASQPTPLPTTQPVPLVANAQPVPPMAPPVTRPPSDPASTKTVDPRTPQRDPRVRYREAEKAQRAAMAAERDKQAAMALAEQVTQAVKTAVEKVKQAVKTAAVPVPAERTRPQPSASVPAPPAQPTVVPVVNDVLPIVDNAMHEEPTQTVYITPAAQPPSVVVAPVADAVMEEYPQPVNLPLQPANLPPVFQPVGPPFQPPFVPQAFPIADVYITPCEGMDVDCNVSPLRRNSVEGMQVDDSDLPQMSTANMELEPDATQLEQVAHGYNSFQTQCMPEPAMPIDGALPYSFVDAFAAGYGATPKSAFLAGGSIHTAVPVSIGPVLPASEDFIDPSWPISWNIAAESIATELHTSWPNMPGFDASTIEPDEVIALGMQGLPTLNDTYISFEKAWVMADSAKTAPSDPIFLVETVPDLPPQDPIIPELLPIDEHPCLLGTNWEVLCIYAADEYDHLAKGAEIDPSEMMDRARHRYCAAHFPQLFNPLPEDVHPHSDGRRTTEPEPAPSFAGGQAPSQPAPVARSSGPYVDDPADASCPGLASTDTSREPTESPPTPVTTPLSFEPLPAYPGKGPAYRKVTIEEVDEDEDD